MASVRDIIGRTVVGPDMYVWALQQAYSNGYRLYDPSFALEQDPAIDEKLRRDPIVQQAMNDRLASVAARDWMVVPADDSKEDKLAARIVERLLKRCRGFRTSRRRLAQAIFDGRAVELVRGERQPLALKGANEGDEIPPGLLWWTPTSMKNIGAKRFRWGVRGGDAANAEIVNEYWSVKRGDWIPVGPDVPLVWLAYDDREQTLGYGRGLREAMYHYYWAKGVCLREGLQGIERWAQGMIVGKINSQAIGGTGKDADAAKAQLLATLRNHRAQYGGIVMDSADEIDVKWPAGTGQAMVIDFIKMLDDAITRLITGALLPSGGGEQGSLARAREEGGTVEKVVQMDRDILDDAITEHLIGCVWEANQPNLQQIGLGDVEMPRYETVHAKVEDPTVNAGVIAQVLQAGMPVKRQEAYEKVGLTMPGPDDDVIQPMLPDVGGTEDAVPPGGGKPQKQRGKFRNKMPEVK